MQLVSLEPVKRIIQIKLGLNLTPCWITISDQSNRRKHKYREKQYVGDNSANPTDRARHFISAFEIQTHGPCVLIELMNKIHHLIFKFH